MLALKQRLKHCNCCTAYDVHVDLFNFVAILRTNGSQFPLAIFNAIPLLCNNHFNGNSLETLSHSYWYY